MARRRRAAHYVGYPCRTAFPDEHVLGADFPPYTPLFQRSSQWVDGDHRAIAELPEDGALICSAVPGFLRKADALLLYELSVHSTGAILEIGAAWGLSTSILARGALNASPPVQVTSIELDPQFVAATQAALKNAGLSSQVTVIQGDASQVTRALASQGRRYALIFVDHDHSLPATQAVCKVLPQLLESGGFAVFHDFNDERNRTEPHEYGVHKGLRQLIEHGGFHFEGITGCCAVVRRMAS